MQDGTENQQANLPVDPGSPPMQTAEKEHPDLYEKTVRSGFWVFSERITQQVLSLVRLLILARILPPREFGVLGIAMLLLQVFETFTVTGFTAALIQRKEEDVHPFLNTAWTVNVMRGTVLFLLFITFAPLAIVFFDGNGTFKPSDFPRPAALAQRLQNQDDPVSVYLMSLLPKESRTDIAAISGSDADISDAKKKIADALNILVNGPMLYQSERFRQVPLSSYAQSSIASVSPDTRQRTNRLLLEQVWPGLIQNTILDRPQLTWIIRVIAMVLLFRAFTNTAIIYFTKGMRFDKTFRLNVGATAINVAVTVTLALVLRSVWALVCGFVFAELTMLLLSYYMHPFRPRFELDLTRFRQLWRFGRWITGSTILDLLLNTGDSILVGRFLGASSLGLYQMSIRLSSLPVSEFTSVIARVLFPALCRMQSDIVRLRDALVKTMDLTSLVVMPAVGIILVLGDDIVRLFMQPSWLPMINTLRILAILGLFRTIPAGALLQALGKPNILTVFMAGRVALIAILFYPLVRLYGLDGMALAVTLSGLILLPAGYVLLSKLLDCSISIFLRRQAAQSIGTLLLMSAVLTIKTWLWTDATFVRLICLGLIGGAVYVFSYVLLAPLFGSQCLASIYTVCKQLRLQFNKVIGSGL